LTVILNVAPAVSPSAEVNVNTGELFVYRVIGRRDRIADLLNTLAAYDCGRRSLYADVRAVALQCTVMPVKGVVPKLMRSILPSQLHRETVGRKFLSEQRPTALP